MPYVTAARSALAAVLAVMFTAGTLLAQEGPQGAVPAQSMQEEAMPVRDRTTVRRDYLREHGLEEQAARLEDFLRYGLEVRAPSWSPEDREREAFNLSFVLLMNGITLDAALAVQDAGVDVIHAIAANARPLVEQALLADVVVIADVIDQEISETPSDGFQVTSKVLVREVLKGSIPQDTLITRQRGEVSERNILPEKGGSYVLLLSRGMYRFRSAVQRPETTAHSAPQNVYNIYRIYRLADGRILWAGYTQEKTARALGEIKWLDDILREHYSAR